LCELIWYMILFTVPLHLPWNFVFPQEAR
jgi:hypothetical protein